MIQIKRILDGNAGRVPHLLEFGQRLQLSNANNQVLIVKVRCVILQEADPQAAHGLLVAAQTRPDGAQLIHVVKVPSIPAVHNVFRFRLVGRMQLLQNRNDGRVALLEIVQEHQDVRVGRQGAPGGVADVAGLGEAFCHVTQHPHSIVDHRVVAQHSRVDLGQDVVHGNVSFNSGFVLDRVEFDDGNLGRSDGLDVSDSLHSLQFLCQLLNDVDGVDVFIGLVVAERERDVKVAVREGETVLGGSENIELSGGMRLLDKLCELRDEMASVLELNSYLQLRF